MRQSGPYSGVDACTGAGAITAVTIRDRIASESSVRLRYLPVAACIHQAFDA